MTRRITKSRRHYGYWTKRPPCPCGSGRKYKQCCQGKKKWHENTRLRAAGLFLLIPTGLFILGQMFFGRENNNMAERPPGPAPPGRVWSPEHGHWHDAR